MLSITAAVSLAASSGRQRITRSTSSISARLAPGSFRLSSAMVFTAISVCRLRRAAMPRPVVPEPPSTNTECEAAPAALSLGCLVSIKVMTRFLQYPWSSVSFGLSFLGFAGKRRGPHFTHQMRYLLRTCVGLRGERIGDRSKNNLRFVLVELEAALYVLDGHHHARGRRRRRRGPAGRRRGRGPGRRR